MSGECLLKLLAEVCTPRPGCIYTTAWLVLCFNNPEASGRGAQTLMCFVSPPKVCQKYINFTKIWI